MLILGLLGMFFYDAVVFFTISSLLFRMAMAVLCRVYLIIQYYLSIRKFYWGVMDAFKKSQDGTNKPFNPQIVVQLLWREFFYTMSVNNPFFGEMDQNKICINIDWYPVVVPRVMPQRLLNTSYCIFCQKYTLYSIKSGLFSLKY